MNAIKIRKMMDMDIEAVHEIEQKSFSIPWSKEALKAEIHQNAQARYIVVQKDREVIGYAGFWKILDEAHITNVAIHPDYRGKGYGNDLMKALMDVALMENIESMTLEVRKSNIPAQKLYEKYGFIACGIRPKYYQDDHEDAVIMWKEHLKDRSLDLKK